MTKITSEAMAARLHVLSVALQEIARALAPAQAAQVADGIRMRVSDLTGAPITRVADGRAIFASIDPGHLAPCIPGGRWG